MTIISQNCCAVCLNVTNGWRYKIVAYFETQTYQPAKSLIKYYFLQIYHHPSNVL